MPSDEEKILAYDQLVRESNWFKIAWELSDGGEVTNEKLGKFFQNCFSMKTNLEINKNLEEQIILLEKDLEERFKTHKAYDAELLRTIHLLKNLRCVKSEN